MDQHPKISGKNYLKLVEKIRSHENISIKDFEIGPTLGNGTFGRVKQVYYRPSPCDFVFALKILKKADLIKLNQVEHIKSEKSILSFVTHPFIYELITAFQTREYIYLLFEYLPGFLCFTSPNHQAESCSPDSGRSAASRKTSPFSTVPR